MNNIVLDFRHNYVRGERLEAAEVAYQYDTGRIVDAFVPETETLFFIHVGFDNDPTLVLIDDVDVEEDQEEGGYKVTATIPDSVFEKYGTLRIYVVAASSEDEIVTTYEGFVPVKSKAAAEDYIVPDEQAQSIIERATVAAARAETAASQIESGGTFAVTDLNNDGNIVMTLIVPDEEE